jgi:hypothetical protein
LLNKLQIIVDREKQISDLLEAGDFPSAIQIMISHRSELSEWKSLQCVKQLDQSMQTGFERVAKQIDDALYSLLGQYDPTSYDRILSAYQLLGHNDITIMGKVF